MTYDGGRFSRRYCGNEVTEFERRHSRKRARPGSASPRPATAERAAKSSKRASLPASPGGSPSGRAHATCSTPSPPPLCMARSQAVCERAEPSVSPHSAFAAAAAAAVHGTDHPAFEQQQQQQEEEEEEEEDEDEDEAAAAAAARRPDRPVALGGHPPVAPAAAPAPSLVAEAASTAQPAPSPVRARAATPLANGEPSSAPTLAKPKPKPVPKPKALGRPPSPPCSPLAPSAEEVESERRLEGCGCSCDGLKGGSSRGGKAGGHGCSLLPLLNAGVLESGDGVISCVELVG